MTRIWRGWEMGKEKERGEGKSATGLPLCFWNGEVNFFFFFSFLGQGEKSGGYGGDDHKKRNI
jgi:hypothetical protein